MENSNQGAVGVESNKVQQKRNMESSEISGVVRSDDTTAAEKRGEVFCPSAQKNILDKKPGFGKVKPSVENHQGNRGWDITQNDDRNAPLPEDGVRLDIHGRRRDEGIVGRSINDANDDSTVYGEDRFEMGRQKNPTKSLKEGFQKRVGKPGKKLD